MANKSNARKRWRKAVEHHIEAIPGSVTRAWNTLTYRLRGEGYYYDKETDFWYYILEEDKRDEAIKAYQSERLEATRLARESEREARHERERKRRERVKCTIIVGDNPHVV